MKRSVGMRWHGPDWEFAGRIGFRSRGAEELSDSRIFSFFLLGLSFFFLLAFLSEVYN